MNQLYIHPLSLNSRMARFVLGMGLIVSVLFFTGPLGAAVYLPLLGIYPTLTAFLGCDPVLAVIQSLVCKTGLMPCPTNTMARA